MEDHELRGHLRLIELHRKFEQTLQAITAAEMADRPMLFGRLRSLKGQMVALEVAAVQNGNEAAFAV